LVLFGPQLKKSEISIPYNGTKYQHVNINHVRHLVLDAYIPSAAGIVASFALA